MSSHWGLRIHEANYPSVLVRPCQFQAAAAALGRHRESRECGAIPRVDRFVDEDNDAEAKNVTCGAVNQRAKRKSSELSDLRIFGVKNAVQRLDVQ